MVVALIGGGEVVVVEVVVVEVVVEVVVVIANARLGMMQERLERCALFIIRFSTIQPKYVVVVSGVVAVVAVISSGSDISSRSNNSLLSTLG